MASPGQVPPSADPLAVLSSLYAPPFLVQLKGLPGGSGWRLEHSEDNGGTWTSLEAGHPGHPSPAAAIDAGAAAIASWRSSRLDAHYAEVATYFFQGKLERRKITILDENNIAI